MTYPSIENYTKKLNLRQRESNETDMSYRLFVAEKIDENISMETALEVLGVNKSQDFMASFLLNYNKLGIIGSLETAAFVTGRKRFSKQIRHYNSRKQTEIKSYNI